MNNLFIPTENTQLEAIKTIKLQTILRIKEKFVQRDWSLKINFML